MAVNQPDSALITTATLKTHLDISHANEDTQLAAIVAQVSAGVSEWCQRRFAETTYTDEEYDGPGGRALYLRAWPVSSVASFKLDTQRTWAASSALTEGTDWMVRNDEMGWGRVDRLPDGYRWPRGRRIIRVTYTAGYSTIPAAVQLAAMRWAAVIYQRSDLALDAVSARSLPVGGGNVTVITPEMPKEVAQLLSPFVRRLY